MDKLEFGENKLEFGEILDQIKNLSFAINKNGYFRFGAL